MIGNNIFVRNGYRLDSAELLRDNLYIKDGILVAVRVNEKVEEPVGTLLLGENFVYEHGCYKVNKIKTLKTVSELRQELYTNGFFFDGVRYVRFKRSSGSSRVGKCLFIDEKLYPAMHKYEMCKIKVKQGEQVELAALEA